MPFIIQEIQTTDGVTALLPAIQKETRPEAESVFYTICGSACISTVPIHTVMTYSEEGVPVKELTKCFRHEPQT